MTHDHDHDYDTDDYHDDAWVADIRRSIARDNKREGIDPEPPRRPRVRHASWTCPTCHTVHTPRTITMDAELMYTLDYLFGHANADGVCGVTAITGCEDAKVIGDRSYGQLRYWGLVEGAGKGKYKLTALGRQYARGVDDVPESVTVRNDVVIARSEYTISAEGARAKVRSRKGKPK